MGQAMRRNPRSPRSNHFSDSNRMAGEPDGSMARVRAPRKAVVSPNLEVACIGWCSYHYGRLAARKIASKAKVS
jgi:hypothetical protein